MKLPLSARIAARYLRAKKSHSAVGAISVVSICGIAVATAAIICVLSVFNGFRSVIAGRLDSLTPDVMVTPAKGKVFADGDSLSLAISRMAGVETALPTILDNALIIYDGHEMPVTLKGADPLSYSRVTSLRDLVIDSSRPVSEIFSNQAGDEFDFDSPRQSVMSVGVAARLGIRSGAAAIIFAPRREGRVNLANPSTSFLRDSIEVAAIYRADQSEFDENRIIVDIETARDLFQYESEASAVEVLGKEGVSPEKLAAGLRVALGDGYVVRDRLQQQSMNFRMISIEKWVSFLLLFFILLIASFNIISSLSMLVIEKSGSIRTLTSLGMPRARIGSIFFWQSIFVTLIGGGTGVVIGIILCLLQQRLGLIRLQGDPGSMIVSAYPVELHPADILITFIPVVLTGLLTALIISSFARSKAKIN